MRRPDEGKYPITQPFGNAHFAKDENGNMINPYAKFGLIGHNGWDIGCPNGTILVAPIKGKITEIANDETGYGIYIKIESDSEGSLLAHNQQILIQLGQYVDEGQSISISNNTGNSTGPHSHWGYFRQPRDRTNGYAGYIDPLPYLTESATLSPSIQMNDQTIISASLLNWDQDLEIQQIRGLLGDLKKLQSQKPPEPIITVDLTQVSVSDLLIAVIKKIFK